MRAGITLLIMMIAVAGSIYAETEKSPKPPLDLQVRQLIHSLREQILPQVGTPKSDVDKIYGEPKNVQQSSGKGNPDDYPMSVYRLLAPIGNDEFRADMLVTYRDNKVYRASINHYCVVKSRPQGSQSPEVKAEIEQENRCVLADLLEIYNKYKVDKASWNVPASR